MTRREQRQKAQAGADLHLQLGHRPVDAIASQESCRIDAAADREWFAKHPTKIRREWPASIRELKAHGMPIGSRTVVLRGPDGAQIRMFEPPVEVN